MLAAAIMSRRTRWQPMPLLSSRTRRKQPISAVKLHDQETEFPASNEILLKSKSSPGSESKRRENVVEEEENHARGERWRFQADLLRAECNLLRAEREIALKKLDKNRVKMENTLRSAVHTLISGKKKIFEGKNENAVFEEEIEDIAEKLEELQMNLRINTSQDLDKENSVSGYRSKNQSNNVDMPRRKMEGLPKGMLDRSVEEDSRRLLCSKATSSVPGSASTSKRIDRFLEPSTFSAKHSHEEPVSLEENKCSGRCKAIISRIIEQVREENEQWSQMQQMLGRIRGEMEEMQASLDFWENRAHDLDGEIQSLRHVVKEWRKKAVGFENKANKLQVELSSLKGTLQKSKTELNSDQTREACLVPKLRPVTLRKQLEKEKHESSLRMEEDYDDIDEKVHKWEKADESLKIMPTKNLPAISLGRQLAKEKLRRLEENLRAHKKNKEELCVSNNRLEDPKRLPLLDIENSISYSRLCNGVGEINTS